MPYVNYYLLLLIVSTAIICGQQLVDDNQHGQHLSSEFSPSSAADALQFSSTNMNRYLMYDVNDGEGFNLRRDVYIRMANLIVQLNRRQQYQWTLVLPPWKKMYHWRSTHYQQFPLPWKTFFDIQSLNKLIPVMEYQDYINQFGSTIDEIIYLQPFPDPFQGGNFVDKVEQIQCPAIHKYQFLDGHYVGYFFGLNNIAAQKLRCMLAQGAASVITSQLVNSNARYDNPHLQIFNPTLKLLTATTS